MARLVACGAFALVALGTAVHATPSIPKDVASFVERRSACDHWRGEEGYDAERRADIQWSVCQFCPGTDAELARLKKKYRTDAPTARRLDEFEPGIEPEDKAEAKAACRGIRKPAWLK